MPPAAPASVHNVPVATEATRVRARSAWESAGNFGSNSGSASRPGGRRVRCRSWGSDATSGRLGVLASEGRSGASPVITVASWDR
jgi:hypothetical protein